VHAGWEVIWIAHQVFCLAMWSSAPLRSASFPLNTVFRSEPLDQSRHPIRSSQPTRDELTRGTKNDATHEHFHT